MAPKVASRKPNASSSSRPNTTVLPKGWPADITYIRRPVYSKNLPPETLTALTLPLQTPPPTSIKASPAPPLHIRITPITSPTHPANGQHGLFAAQHLSPDTLILPYLGYVHTKADEDPASDYDLSLDRELGVGVDATKVGNEARFVNDYRGVADAPNAEFREGWLDVGGGVLERVMAVHALSAGKSGKGKRARGILKGEEVLVSYGKGFWGERGKVEEEE